jgi:hypothetical protein
MISSRVAPDCGREGVQGGIESGIADRVHRHAKSPRNCLPGGR